MLLWKNISLVSVQPKGYDGDSRYPNPLVGLYLKLFYIDFTNYLYSEFRLSTWKNLTDLACLGKVARGEVDNSVFTNLFHPSQIDAKLF